MQNLYEHMLLPAIILCAALLVGCGMISDSTGGKIVEKSFGKMPDGTPVSIFTLRNARGAEAKISNYGGTVTSLKTPDREGKMGDVVLGYDTLDGYLKASPYFGCLIGRFGNRIAKGQFTLDGKTHQLATNNGPNTLHGGLKGFDKVVWGVVAARATSRDASLELRYVSKDGEEGYPGNLTVTAIYTLTDDNSLRVDFTTTTDKSTIVNLTHHSYFNLAGKGDILGHEVMIVSDEFTPVDETLIPTGELKPVKGTPLDFNTPTAIGARINSGDEQIKLGKGYDHNWVIKKQAGKLGLMARVTEPTTGRVMEVLSTEPGMQFYSGNFLDGSITGKGGWVYQFRNGFCMEPQHYPDSPNKPNFPSAVLKPGDIYKNTIIYKFSVR